MLKSVSVETKSARELDIMRRAGAVVARSLEALAKACVPGIDTAELDKLAAAELKRRGAKPAFLGYRGYPAVLCASINEEVVHGIPKRGRILREGDIIGLDFGAEVDGYFGDAALTVPIGRVSDEARRLIETTREALKKGIEAARNGSRVGDVASAVQRHAESAGFSVVREFIGHGIGRSLHEDPPVPNYGEPGTGTRLRPGMTLAIEPMINAGGAAVRVLEDRWTAVTTDGSLSAHFEHTVVVTDGDPEILTL